MQRLSIEQHGPIIKRGRVQGKGYREIQEAVELETGVSVSHTAFRNLWIDKMDGAAIDNMIETAQKAVKAAAMKEAQEQGTSPSIDPVRAQEAINDLEGMERYKRLVTLLIDGNLKAHIETGERLKTEYPQYLKLLKQIEPTRPYE